MTAAPPRIHIVLFITSTFLFWTALYVYVPILAPYARHLGGSMTAIGLVVSSYGMMQLMFRIPLGVWSDRIGRRKPFIVAGLLLLAASGLALGLSPSPEWMIIARSLGGLAACSWVTWSVMYAGYFDPSRTPVAMSHLAVISALGQMLSTYAGGWIADGYGWQMPFYIGTVLSFLSLVFLLPLPDGAITRSGTMTMRRIKSIGLTRTLLFVSVVAAISQYINFITIYGFTPVYANQIGASSVQQGTLILVGMACQMVFSYIGGAWCSFRLGNRQTIILGFVITGLGTAMIPYTGAMTLLYCAQAISGVGRGLMQPILMALAVQAIPQEDRGTAMGVFQAIYAIGMFSGPAIGGVLGDWFGLGAIFLSTAVICAMTACVMGKRGLVYWLIGPQ